MKTLEIDIDCDALTNDQIAATLKGIAREIERGPIPLNEKGVWYNMQRVGTYCAVDRSETQQ